MKTLFGILIACLLVGCSPEVSFDDVDKEAINQMRRSYVNGWLANDSETIIGLFDADATIIPSGLSPLTGLPQIEEYWFPNDSSETIIHFYEVELLNLNGTDSMAYSLEKGKLNFTYTKGDFTITKESISHASTVYKKNKEGNWKIISRMWTSLNQ